MTVHLDTHVALWLVAGEKRRLRPARTYLHRGSLWVSPIVLIELQVLYEIGKIREPVDTVVDVLTEHGVEEAAGEASDIGHYARSLSWTRDPFDRLIVAHALASRAILLTADGTIRENCPQAHWDS